MRMINKGIIVALCCGMVLSCVGCGKTHSNNGDHLATNEESNVTTTAQEIESTSENVGQDSKELYQDFLNGKAKVYTEKRDFWMYDFEKQADVSYYDNPAGYDLNGFVRKVIDRESSYEMNMVKEVKWAYLDCGADGEPELALHIDFTMGNEELFREYIIKNIDGKLQLCYQMETYYRSSEQIVNSFGMIEAGGSSSAFSFGNARAIVDANGDYQFWYGTQIDYSGLRALDSRFDDAIVNSNVDSPANMYMEVWSFDEAPREYEGPVYDAYVEGLKYCAERTEDRESNGVDFAENVQFFQKLFNQAGVSLCSIDEIKGLVESRKKSLGITDEMIEATAIEWTSLVANLAAINGK